MSTSRTSASGSAGLRVEQVERLLPVGRELDLVALELERAPKRLAHGPLVVHHEDSHARIVACRT